MESIKVLIAVFGGGILGCIVAGLIFLGGHKLFFSNDKEVTPKKQVQEITSTTGKKAKVSLIGTYAIKKLDIDEGSIYFTDGRAVFVNK
jgi:hypothetical protein